MNTFTSNNSNDSLDKTITRIFKWTVLGVTSAVTGGMLAKEIIEHHDRQVIKSIRKDWYDPSRFEWELFKD